jgi:hypothetical protein
VSENRATPGQHVAMSAGTIRAPGLEMRAGSRIGPAASLVGGPVFLVGTALHPPRHGRGIAEVGELYGLTHSVQAIGLLLLGVALANLLTQGRSGPWALAVNAALVGTLAWLGLIVYDGAHNPATARYAPELIHTSADLDIGAALIVMPALIFFPLGYTLLASVLLREGLRWSGLLLGTGAVTYTVGGVLIFALGPHSPAVQPVEVVGALAFACGYVLLGLTWRALSSDER